MLRGSAKEFQYLHRFINREHRKIAITMVAVTDELDAAYVRPLDGHMNVKEQFLYHDRAVNCAVMQVMPTPSVAGHTNRYELRVWNSSSMYSSASACLPMFRKFSARALVVYKEKCHRIFERQRQETVESRYPEKYYCTSGA
ncbi:hypothetical protein MTO96_034678 [Rhipicephalus appendiculatus]